jgi:6-phosphofructokinase 1
MSTTSPQSLAVFTSGGDAPGMNACIRAVVRTARMHQLNVVGIRRGYEGMIDGDTVFLDERSVSNIIQRGGTMLKTARSARFMTDQGLDSAAAVLRNLNVSGVVAIGGDGTFKGARAFTSRFPEFRFIGIPGTIDNDISGTDFTLGFDTALNTVVEAIDKIRDTAASHDRCFFIEVMGRDSGCIALWSGLAGGAEEILLPERNTNVDDLVALLRKGSSLGKSSSIVIVAEGEQSGGAAEVAAAVRGRLPHVDTKVTVLGHVQRGGSPTVADRILGAKFGTWAVEALLQNVHGAMVGVRDGKKCFIPFEHAVKSSEPLDPELYRINRILAT